MDMERGEVRVRCMERVTWRLILLYVKQIANRNLLYDSGNSNRGSEAEAWVGEGDGREFREGGDMNVPMADSCRCKTENHKIL